MSCVLTNLFELQEQCLEEVEVLHADVFLVTVARIIGGKVLVGCAAVLTLLHHLVKKN